LSAAEPSQTPKTSAATATPKVTDTAKAPIFTFTPRYQEKRAWKLIGLEGVDVKILVINPEDPAILYASDNFVLYKSTDSGSSWIRLQSYPGYAMLRALAIDPSDPETLLAGDMMGVFKSTDGGNSWKLITRGLTITEFDFDPVTPSTIYACVEKYGIYKSIDSGESWNSITGDLINDVQLEFYARNLAIDPTNPNIIYFATSDSVYKSTDGTYNWINLSNSGLVHLFDNQPAPIFSLAIDPSSPTTLYAGSDGFIFKSTNSGDSWVDISEEIPDGDYMLPYYSLVFDPSTPGVLYIASGAGVFMTKDGGASWFKINSGLPPKGRDIPILIIDPSNPTRLYAGVDGVDENLQSIKGVYVLQ
jgi:photosystem II stability/assembly factor-like uncharacterized protein